MAVYLLPQDGSSLVLGFGTGGLGNSGDLILAEHHENTVDITEHPVEVGANITDNIRQTLNEFTIDVWLTNTPIVTDELEGRGFEDLAEYNPPVYEIPFSLTPGGLFRAAGGAIGAAVDAITGAQPKGPVKFRVLQFDTPFDRPREVQSALIKYQSAGVLFDVITSARFYKGMAIKSVSMTREEPGGAPMSIALKEIKTVSSSSVAAPKTDELRGQKKTSAGAQSGKDGSSSSASLAVKAADSVGVVKSWLAGLGIQ